MDLTSFLWGAAIGVACAFGTGFFKKAGEDCYSWAKRKINPKLAEKNPPHLIIQMNTDGAPNIKQDKVSAVTVDDIRNAINNAPPLQRDRVAEGYIGLQVEWEALFKHGTLTKKDEIRVLLTVVDAKLYYGFVRCTVPAKEYRALGILPENAKVRVYGEIAEIDGQVIDLKDARLHIYGKPQ
jgi:hypothetical protein